MEAIGGGSGDGGRGAVALAREVLRALALRALCRGGDGAALGGGAALGAARKPDTQPASRAPFCQRCCEVFRLQGDCMVCVLRGSRTCSVSGRGTV